MQKVAARKQAAGNKARASRALKYAKDAAANGAAARGEGRLLQQKTLLPLPVANCASEPQRRKFCCETAMATTQSRAQAKGGV